MKLTSLNLKASFHQKTLQAKPLTGEPCLKYTELTLNPEFMNSYESIRKTSAYQKNGQLTETSN